MDMPVVDRVYVSWEEDWALPKYVDRYLKSRRIAATRAAHERVLVLLASYKGQRPFTKADLDYYLDANLDR